MYRGLSLNFKRKNAKVEMKEKTYTQGEIIELILRYSGLIALGGALVYFFSAILG